MYSTFEAKFTFTPTPSFFKKYFKSLYSTEKGYLTKTLILHKEKIMCLRMSTTCRTCQQESRPITQQSKKTIYPTQ